MTKFKNGGTGKSEVSTRLFTGPHERAPRVHLKHHTNFDLFLAEKSLDAIKKTKVHWVSMRLWNPVHYRLSFLFFT